MTITTDGWTFFPLIDTMDLQQQQTDLRDIFTERTVWGAFPPGPRTRVESIISQRGETWKSKALLIYHFKCVLFVSSWKKKLSFFLEFYWLLPSICLLHDAAFCRRVGWWSCVMVTVLLKKIRNRQRCLKHFPPSKCQDGRHYFKISGEGREAVVFLSSCFLEEKASGAYSKQLFCIITLQTCNCKCTVYRCDMLPVKTRFKCGNYTMGA